MGGALVCSGKLPVASRYMDGRSQAVLRMEIEDEGLVMPCATGPDSCDTYGAREAVVVEYDGTYYLHYDGAGKTGWLSCLATQQRPAPLGKTRTTTDAGRRRAARFPVGLFALAGAGRE